MRLFCCEERREEEERESEEEVEKKKVCSRRRRVFCFVLKHNKKRVRQVVLRATRTLRPSV